MSSTPLFTSTANNLDQHSIVRSAQTNAEAESWATSRLLSDLPIESNTLMFGLNFKHTTVPKKGLINKFKGNEQDMDLDLSCVLFDANLAVLDTIWFKNLRDVSASVRHHGDSLDGKDRSDLAELDRHVDVETIEVRLTKLPNRVAHMAFLVSSYYGYELQQIERGNVTLGDDEGNLIHDVDLTRVFDAQALCVALISREFDDWRCHLTLNKFKAFHQTDLNKSAQHELSRLYIRTL